MARTQEGTCRPGGARPGLGDGLGTSPSRGRWGPGRGSPSGLDETAEVVPSVPSFKSQANPGSERGGERLASHSTRPGSRPPPLGFLKIAPKWGRAEARPGMRAPPAPSLQPDVASREADGEGVSGAGSPGDANRKGLGPACLGAICG